MESAIPISPNAGESNLDRLKQYSRLKLELASIIRSIQQLARERNDTSQENECQKLMARLAEDRFNLAVVGQFNRGKTSLMNALLGSDKLPTGVLPLTSVVTAVCYGDREQALVQIKGSYLRQTIGIQDLPQFVTQSGNPGNKKQVEYAEVRLPAEMLRLGFFFTDTPGIGSAITANTKTTRDFLPEVDAAIFVTSFEAPLAEPELGFFDEVRSRVDALFVVINKADLVAPAQRNEILAFAREQLGRRYGTQDFPLFTVSARDALEAKLSGRVDFTDGGLTKLEQALAEFLRTKKSRVLLAHVADRADGLMIAIRQELETGERARTDPVQAKLAAQELHERIDRLRSEHEQLLAPLGDKIGAELVGRLDGEISAWCAEVHRILIGRAETSLKTIDGLTLLAGAPELASALSAICRERAQAWLTDHSEAIQRGVREAAADYISALDRSVEKAFAADKWSSLGLPRSSLWPESAADIVDRIPMVYPLPPPLLWRFAVRWSIYALPLPSIKGHVLRRCSESLNEGFSAYSDELRSCLRTIANEWADRLHGALIETAHAALVRAESILQRPPNSAEHAVVDRLLGKLRDLRNEIAAFGDETDAGVELSNSSPVSNDPVGEAQKSDALGNCVICARTEDEIFRLLSRLQYELSTDEAERLGHAERRGFCPLHTWQYESVASAQGICTAYPPLLITLSRRLRALAQAPESAADDVQQLLPDTMTCPACRLTSSSELHAAKALVASLSAADTEIHWNLPALCLPHLISVLRADPGEALARLLLLDQARVMENIAEDMQRYALKHDAVRRSLTTEGEWRAHTRALSRLVGSRNVSKPWKPR